MKQEALVGIGDVSAAGDFSSGDHGAVGTVWWLTAAESAVEQWLSSVCAGYLATVPALSAITHRTLKQPICAGGGMW